MRLPRPRPWWAAPPIVLFAVALALEFAIAPRHDSLDAVPDTLRALAGAVVLFGLAGLGVTRLLLPRSLRRHELLWVLPIGACASGLALMAVGFSGVPFALNLSVVLIAGAALTVFAYRRDPGAPAQDGMLWPLLLALVTVGVALIPLVMQMHFATVTGDGSDAHLAAGSANFLQHAHPTGEDLAQPTDRMPLLWRSKYPIYYAFAGVSSLAGLETWQTLIPVAAVLLALAAIGMFLLARDLLGAGAGVAACAMGFAGLDRMVLHTGTHPYFNQTWGYMAMPFALVLAWWLVRPGEPARDRRGSAALLAMFVAVLVFAYPLALPFVAMPLVVLLWRERRRRLAEGRPVPGLRGLYRGPWSLVYLVPGALVLLFPLRGVTEKIRSASNLFLDQYADLSAWGGDLRAFIPMTHFINLPDTPAARLAMGAIVLLAFRELRRHQPRALLLGLGLVLVVFLWQASAFRGREVGYYFHFKILAFTAPLLLVLAAVHLGRLRRLGPPVLAAFAVATAFAVRAELDATGRQLGRDTVELAEWAQKLPADASVRLDMEGGRQLWGAYFLASRRTCSKKPLLESDYPHVAQSRKADFIVVHAETRVPPEALGDPVFANIEYALYRMNPFFPGPDLCSYRQDSRVSEAAIPG
ncbi:MAG: hypothetical protein WKF94_02620 [Solirubrobacteraceae bacterium]